MGSLQVMLQLVLTEHQLEVVLWHKTYPDQSNMAYLEQTTSDAITGSMLTGVASQAAEAQKET